MKGKTRLGKGLDALFSTPIEQIPPQIRKSVHEIDTALIDPNPFQPRQDMDPVALEELKKSIKEKGIIQPVAVRQVAGGRFQLIAGERRLRAAIEVGLKKVPAFVLEVKSDEDMLELALIENVQREHLNPIELARGYQRLIDECQLTQEEVAAKIGKDRTTVANVIRLLKLPQPIQDSLKRGEIREGHARAILALSDEEKQIEVWKKAVKEGLSVRKVEELVKKIRESEKGHLINRPVRKKSPFISRIESTLREKLGTQVKIRTKKEGGSIEIVFYSREDLDRLMELFEEIKV